MRRRLLRGTRTFIAVFLLLSGTFVDAVVDCVGERPYATSLLAVQVWDQHCGFIPRATVTIVNGRGETVASGQTDDDAGYVSFAGLSPGNYVIVVAAELFERYERPVRLRRRSEYPGRSLLIALDYVAAGCNSSCTAPARGPYRKPPDCVGCRR